MNIPELIKKLRADCSAQRMAEHCGSLSTVEVAPEDLEQLFNEIWRLRPVDIPKTGGPKLPKQIWVDYDPDYARAVRWSFYRTKAEQRGNRPDLKPIRLCVTRGR